MSAAAASASARLAEGLAPVPQQPNGMNKVPTALLWLRRDLRVADNPALVAALQGALHVVPVFIWAPEEEGQFQPGRCSRWWLLQSLTALEADFKALGSSLIYRCAPESRTALIQLAQETGAQALFFNHLYDPISMVRDNEVKAAMAGMGVACHTFNSDVLYEPWEVLSPSGQPLTNFQDFWDRINSMSYPPPLPLPVPASMPAVHPSIVGLDLRGLGLLTSEEESSNQQLDFTWQPGGRGAHLVLEEFVLQRLRHFSANRAKTDVRSTSRLSPHVHNGEISTRHIYYVVKQQEAAFASNGEPEEVRSSCSDYLRQMGYREYSRYLSFHFPFTHERSLLEHVRACPWRFDQGNFKAWRQGRTGYPLVDAGMRELWSTGWMHNRLRVVCASFLVKNLLLPWQWGLKHYWDAQLDADLECDALGWQYCSGCLSDAHPFSYMLDHKTEALRFDPSGNYIRRWLPVLSRMPAKWIHRPAEAPAEVLQDAGVELGTNYEWPIVSLVQSKAHLAHACSVIDRCIAQTGRSESAASEPYRMPSAPISSDMTPPGVRSSSKQAGQQPQQETAKARNRAAGWPTRPPPFQDPNNTEATSDEEVLSNTIAETRVPPQLLAAASGVSGTASRTPDRRSAASKGPAAGGGDDDDTLTVNNAGAVGAAANAAAGNGAATGTAAAVGNAAVGKATQTAAADARKAEDTLNGAVQMLQQQAKPAIAAQEPAVTQRAGGAAPPSAGVKTEGPQTGAAAPNGQQHSSPRSGRRYPASWAQEEILAHQAGDTERLRELQVERLRKEQQELDSHDDGGEVTKAAFSLMGGAPLYESNSGTQPKPADGVQSSVRKEGAAERHPDPAAAAAQQQSNDAAAVAVAKAGEPQPGANVFTTDAAEVPNDDRRHVEAAVPPSTTVGKDVTDKGALNEAFLKQSGVPMSLDGMVVAEAAAPSGKRKREDPQ